MEFDQPSFAPQNDAENQWIKIIGGIKNLKIFRQWRPQPAFKPYGRMNPKDPIIYARKLPIKIMRMDARNQVFKLFVGQRNHQQRIPATQIMPYGSKPRRYPFRQYHKK